MRITSSVVAMALCAALLTACSKQESSTSEPPKAATEAQNSVESATPAVQQSATAAASEAQTMIDKAKAFIADNKYAEAMDLLKRLSSMQLTPEQTQLVEDLKAQVQKAIASDPAKSVGGLLGK